VIFIKRALLVSFFVLFVFSSWVGFPQSSRSDSGRTLHFADQQWIVTDSYGSKIAPGSNYFSSSENNVSVDKNDTLRLALRYDNQLNAWTSSQIISKDFAQYGTYSFIIDQNLQCLDQNVVLGIFLYKSDPTDPSSRAEIDLEFSKWGFPKQNEMGDWIDLDHNSWYVLWPAWQEGETPIPQATESFYLQMTDYEKTMHEIQWEDFYLSFRSYVFDPIKHEYDDLKPPYYQAEFQQTTFSEDEIYIPFEEDNMKFMINLWLIEEVSDPFCKEEVEITLQMKYRMPGQ
jgi:hypothetical protein